MMLKHHFRAGVVGGFAGLAGAVAATHAATVEPDDFAPGTELTAVSPSVTLNTEAPTSGDGFRIVPNFVVTAEEGDTATADASPTGDLVFAHAGIPFFNTNRILRGDFAGATSRVSLAFSPNSTLTEQVGRLEAYGFAGDLLSAVETAPLLATNGGLVTETLSISRPETNDIAFFRAYTSEGSFGRLDALSFGDVTPVDILAGDFSGDGFVSQADLDLILLNWGDTALPAGFDPVALAQPGPIWGFDGQISQNELDAVLLNWGSGTPPAPGSLSPPPSLTAIPEPASAAAVGVLGVLGLGRRR